MYVQHLGDPQKDARSKRNGFERLTVIVAYLERRQMERRFRIGGIFDDHSTTTLQILAGRLEVCRFQFDLVPCCSPLCEFFLPF